MKVYVVTDGHYSDMHIAAVYDTETAAQRHADGLYAGDYEEWEVGKAYPVPKGYKIYYVQYSPHRDQWYTSLAGGSLSLAGESDIYKTNIGKWNDPEPEYDYYFRTYCFARDEQHALKIASERKAIMTATYGSKVECSHDFGKRVPESINAQ